MDTSNLTTSPANLPDQPQRILSRHIQDAVARKQPIGTVTLPNAGSISATTISALASRLGLDVRDVEIQGSPRLPSNHFFWWGTDGDGEPVFGSIKFSTRSTPRRVEVTANISILDIDARTFTAAQSEMGDDAALSLRAWLMLIADLSSEASKDLISAPPQVATASAKLRAIRDTAIGLLWNVVL